MAPLGGNPPGMTSITGNGEGSNNGAGDGTGNGNGNGSGNTPITTTVNGDNNTVTIFYVGSAEENQALRDLFKDKYTLDCLRNTPDAEIPARLFELWKGGDAPQQLKNIRVAGDKVHEVRGPGKVVRVSRSKFVKQTVADMLGTVSAMDPDATPDPNAMQEIREEVADLKYQVAKKQKSSATEVAKMHLDAAPELRTADYQTREFLRRAKQNIEKAMDHPSNNIPTV